MKTLCSGPGKTRNLITFYFLKLFSPSKKKPLLHVIYIKRKRALQICKKGPAHQQIKGFVSTYHSVSCCAKIRASPRFAQDHVQRGCFSFYNLQYASIAYSC